VLNGKDPFIPKEQGFTKVPGITPLCRVTSCFRKIVDGTASDKQDEYCQISESSVEQSLRQFCKLIIHELGDEYLNRMPTDK